MNRNRNQITLLLFLVVFVGLAGLMIYSKRNDFSKEGNPAIGKKLLGEFPVNDVAGLTIKEGTNELILAKKEGTWRVLGRNDYPANYSEISEFLIKLKDLKVVQSEKVGRPAAAARVLDPVARSSLANVIPAVIVLGISRPGEGLRASLDPRIAKRPSGRRRPSRSGGGTGRPVASTSEPHGLRPGIADPRPLIAVVVECAHVGLLERLL